MLLLLLQTPDKLIQVVQCWAGHFGLFGLFGPFTSAFGLRSLVYPREHSSPSSTALQKTANMWRFPRCRMVCISQVWFWCIWCTWQDVWWKHVYSLLAWLPVLFCVRVFIQAVPDIPYMVVTRFSYVLRHAAHKLDVRIRKDSGALETQNETQRQSSWAVNASAMIRWTTEI